MGKAQAELIWWERLFLKIFSRLNALEGDSIGNGRSGLKRKTRVTDTDVIM